MSDKQIAAEKVAREIAGDFGAPLEENWTLRYSLTERIQAAIDEETKPLVEALGEARRLLTTEYGLKPESFSICYIDAALAPFKEGGDSND